MNGSPWLSRADLVIGIDDTDVIDAPGTGRLVQDLIAVLAAEGWGEGLGASRHQLLQDPRVPMTSHNCAAAISWCSTRPERRAEFAERIGAFLEERAPVGADPGLAMIRADDLDRVRHPLAEHGRRAQRRLLLQREAWDLAAQLDVHLSAHGGTSDGVIGALAAAGLHAGGNDGFFLWMPGIRELEGSCTVRELLAAVPIDRIGTLDGDSPGLDDVIALGNWVRPLLTDGRSHLLASRVAGPVGDERTHWAVAPRETVKQY